MWLKLNILQRNGKVKQIQHALCFLMLFIVALDNRYIAPYLLLSIYLLDYLAEENCHQPDRVITDEFGSSE